MENEKRLVYADALMKSIKGYKLGKIPKGELEWKIENAPTVDAVEVVRGRWEPHPEANGFERCSVCHDCIIYDDWVEEPKWYYCPNCGALMDGGSDNE